MSSKKVTIVYRGVRVMHDETVAHCFLHGKEEKYWTKTKYAQVGYEYEATLTDKGELLLPKVPYEIGVAAIDEDTLERWCNESDLAQQFAKRKRAAKAAQRKIPEIAKLAQPLRKKYKACRTFEDQQSFEEIVLKAIKGRYDK